MRKVIILSIIQFFVLSGLFAQGRIIIPHPPEQFPQKQIDLNRVNADIHIRGNVGTITLEQVFSNPSQFRLEGEYLFAIPDEANVNKLVDDSNVDPISGFPDMKTIPVKIDPIGKALPADN